MADQLKLTDTENNVPLSPEEAGKISEKSAKTAKKSKTEDADGGNTGEPPKPKRIADNQIIMDNPEKNYVLNQEIPDEDVLNEPGSGNGMGAEPTRKRTIEDFTDEMLNEALSDPLNILVARKIVAAADALEAEKNKPAPPTAEEMEAASYSRLVAKYGKDYVLAKKGANQTYFNRATWNSMGKNKMGWVEHKTTMPEVQK